MHTEERVQHNNAFCLVYLCIYYLCWLSLLQFCSINHYWDKRVFNFKLSLMDSIQTKLPRFLYHWLVDYIQVSSILPYVWGKTNTNKSYKTVPTDTSNDVRSTEEQVIYKLKQEINPLPIHWNRVHLSIND